MTNIAPIIYKPWSPRVLSICIDGYRNGQIPVLNLDLSAKCTLCSCLYCDSKVGKAHPEELSANEVKLIINELHNYYGLKWIHICGLGEPTEDSKLFTVFECAKSLGIEVSFFTNGMGIDKESISKLKTFPINIALKLDSLNEGTFDLILGKTGVAKRIYNFLDILLDSGFLKITNQETNLALSIVPTKLNFMDIDDVVEFCKRKNIFPAIGEAEDSNKAIINHERLYLSRNQLLSLKSRVSKLLEFEYERPLCPGIFPSLHIDHLGNVIIDKQTGLSCCWFFMKEPSYELIGNCRLNSLKEIIPKIQAYRNTIRTQAEALLKEHNPVFGGGGSLPLKWYQIYLSSLDEHLKTYR